MAIVSLVDEFNWVTFQHSWSCKQLVLKSSCSASKWYLEQGQQRKTFCYNEFCHRLFFNVKFHPKSNWYGNVKTLKLINWITMMTEAIPLWLTSQPFIVWFLFALYWVHICVFLCGETSVIRVGWANVWGNHILRYVNCIPHLDYCTVFTLCNSNECIKFWGEGGEWNND